MANKQIKEIIGLALLGEGILGLLWRLHNFLIRTQVNLRNKKILHRCFIITLLLN